MWCMPEDNVRLIPYSVCSVSFFSRNSVFFSQQFSQNSVFQSVLVKIQPGERDLIADPTLHVGSWWMPGREEVGRRWLNRCHRIEEYATPHLTNLQKHQWSYMLVSAMAKRVFSKYRKKGKVTGSQEHGGVGMKTVRIWTDITDITFVFIFLSGFGFEYE